MDESALSRQPAQCRFTRRHFYDNCSTLPQIAGQPYRSWEKASFGENKVDHGWQRAIQVVCPNTRYRQGQTLGDYGRLSVHDRGPGISKEEQASLFQRYVRLSSKPTRGESSTGIGLALARQRARTIGGDIVYEERQGGGSSFTFELPLAVV